MATKTKTKTITKGFRPAPYIGFDGSPADHGGMKNPPAVVIAMHPIYGTRVYGPFIRLDAARAWVDDDAEMEVVGDFGSARGWSFHATTTEVPGHWL